VELLPLRVPAKVIVRFENQNARIGASLLAEEMAAANPLMPEPTDQIVGGIRGSGVPAVCQKLPSRKPCAASNEPTLSPRIPLAAGGS